MSSTPSPLLSVDSAHPSLPGHFPGMAVVPGVVFLSFILDEVKRQLPLLQVCGVRKLKFLQMLLPQQRFVVEFSEPAQGSLRFKCWRDQQVDGSVSAEPRQLLVDGNLHLVAPAQTGLTS